MSGPFKKPWEYSFRKQIQSSKPKFQITNSELPLPGTTCLPSHDANFPEHPTSALLAYPKVTKTQRRRQVTSMLQKNHHDRLGGNTGPASRALERNLFNVRHDRPLPLLDLTLGEVPGYLYNFNKSRIPRCRLPAGRQGSVPGGSAHCNNEVNSN